MGKNSKNVLIVRIGGGPVKWIAEEGKEGFECHVQAVRIA